MGAGLASMVCGDPLKKPCVARLFSSPAAGRGGGSRSAGEAVAEEFELVKEAPARAG
jgi:hypothetical protein